MVYVFVQACQNDDPSLFKSRSGPVVTLPDKLRSFALIRLTKRLFVESTGEGSDGADADEQSEPASVPRRVPTVRAEREQDLRSSVTH